jgi:2'-hydroxyisoflavone reductase
MKLLMLGGTVFLGRHIVEAALERGHEVTMFNRGKSNADLFPTVEKIQGNRDGEIAKLSGRKWDAVIDTCGYVPRIVRQSVEALKDSTERYVFISSISAYANVEKPGVDETAPSGGKMDDPNSEDVRAYYGPLKAACENVVMETYGDGALIIRPGLIVGPHDPTDRYTYWVWRLAQGGEVLAPGDGSTNVQYIDVRDLAGWIIHLLENGKGGIYNAVGPNRPYSFTEFLEDCRQAAGTQPKLIWADSDFLAEKEVQPWSELPLYIPAGAGEPDARLDGMLSVSVAKAFADGLNFLSPVTTARDTLTWRRSLPADVPFKAGLSREKEVDVLDSFQQRATSAEQ